jgi:DNA-binding LytR/AlgR family response regulator
MRPKTTPINGTQPAAAQLLPVKHDRKVVLLKVDDIDWVGSGHNYVTLRVGKRSHLLRGTLDEIAHRLPSDKFVRISRFSLVQVDRIKELELFDSGDYRVTLHTGTKLMLSRRYRADLRRRGLL